LRHVGAGLAPRVSGPGRALSERGRHLAIDCCVQCQRPGVATSKRGWRLGSNVRGVCYRGSDVRDRRHQWNQPSGVWSCMTRRAQGLGALLLPVASVLVPTRVSPRYLPTTRTLRRHRQVCAHTTLQPCTLGDREGVRRRPQPCSRPKRQRALHLPGPGCPRHPPTGWWRRHGCVRPPRPRSSAPSLRTRGRTVVAPRVEVLGWCRTSA